MISPPHILESNNQLINLDISEYWSGCNTSDNFMVTCEAKRDFESGRARWWYLAISRCQNGSIQVSKTVSLIKILVTPALNHLLGLYNLIIFPCLHDGKLDEAER